MLIGSRTRGQLTTVLAWFVRVTIAIFFVVCLFKTIVKFDRESGTKQINNGQLAPGRWNTSVFHPDQMGSSHQKKRNSTNETSAMRMKTEDSSLETLGLSFQLSRLSNEFNLEKLDSIPEYDPVNEIIPCQNDCKRLEDLIRKWPLSKPKAAIYYLTQPSRIKSLKKSLLSLDKHFNNEHKYPVIIFHQKDFIPFISTFRNLKYPIYFEEISLNRPGFLSKRLQYNIPCISSITYRDMCRFHYKTVYLHSIIRLFDYLLRLDDDSIITDPIRYDLFNVMRTHDIAYGYIWEFYDSFGCVQGLWNATNLFINASGIKPHFINSWPAPKLYYNNFEVSKTSLWLSNEYMRYANFLDRLGGTFYHRWGDAPIKGLAVAMMLPRNRTHLFSDVGYNHQTFTNTPAP